MRKLYYGYNKNNERAIYIINSIFSVIGVFFAPEYIIKLYRNIAFLSVQETIALSLCISMFLFGTYNLALFLKFIVENANKAINNFNKENE